MSSYEQGGEGMPTEHRETHTVARTTATPPTRSGGHAAITGVERIASRARREPQTRYTALMHHYTVGNLRARFETLEGTKAPGMDGGTKAMYGQHLEANLRALHQKLRHKAYRPKPVRQGRESQRRRQEASVGDQLYRRQECSGDDTSYPGGDL